MRGLSRFLALGVLVVVLFMACMDFGGDQEPSGCEPVSVCLFGDCACSGVVCPDDGNPCTRNYCSGGRCVTDARPNGTACTYDGMDGVCVNGVCGENLCKDVRCDDEPCSRGECDYVDGLCDYTPRYPDGTACVYDGTEGVCVNGVCGENLCADVVCDDDDSCTVDTCDYVDGSCVYTPDQPNGEPCTSGDLEGVCVNGVCGENLCEGVDCDDDDACTHDSCDYVDGSCFHAEIGEGEPCMLDGLSGRCARGVCLVDCTGASDGTPCGDGAGACQGGSCVGRFACTEQGIRDAIWVGDGPHTFDCNGPQRVFIGATLVIDTDVILDGESELIIDGEEAYGAVAVEDGITAELRGVTVTGVKGNPSDEWGGIFNQGMLTVVDSTVSGNTSIYGGGIRNEGTLTLTRSTVSGNEALHGAGIYNFGTLVATNVTLSGNRTPTPNNFDSGAAVRNQGVMTMTHCTVSGNQALHGGDVAQYHQVPAVITNTLIDGSCFLHSGTITSAGYNIESTGDTCGFGEATDQVRISANELALGPLQDNGGPTETHVPDAGSAAVDAIPSSMCEVDVDQRGEPRPETGGTRCDVGAVELR
jgi:hypothetical protein